MCVCAKPGTAARSDLIGNIYSKNEKQPIFLIVLDLDMITEKLLNSCIIVNCRAASVNRHLKP